MTRDVFISYATEDKPTADAVCHRLEAEGIRCWIAPRDLPPGADFPERLVEAIRRSRIMVVVFSSHANASRYVKLEVYQAFERELTTIPFRIEQVEPGPGLELHLRMIHWLDALTPPLESHLEELTARVRQILAAEEPGGGEDLPSEARRPVRGTASDRFDRYTTRGRLATLRRLAASPQAAALGLGLLPLFADFVLHLHVGPPWPSRMVADLVGGLINALTFAVVWQLVRTAGAERLKRHLLMAGAAGAASFALYAALFGFFVVDAPTAHDQDVRGFRVQPEVASLIEKTPGLTLATVLEGAENRPDRVWELWTIVVARVCLLAGWLVLNVSLAAIVALLFALSRVPANVPTDRSPSQAGPC
jgi:hypothetical protein